MSTPRWAKFLAVVSVVLVAGVAAIVSYSHMRTLAIRAGEGWRSVLLPLSVDGMLVAASLVLLVRRRSGLPGSVLAWLALVLGLAVSLVANVAAAEPTLVGRLVAAWPPLAFGIAYELLLHLVRPVGVASLATTSPTEAVDAEPLEAAPAEDRQPVASSSPATPEVGGDQHQPAVEQSPAEPGDDLDDLVRRARKLVADAKAEGRPMGRGNLARALGRSEHRVRQVQAAMKDNPRPALHAVGGGR